ncbi:MAG: hypothetical protein ACXVAX_00740 [Pseudobdellovibrio sp.]
MKLMLALVIFSVVQAQAYNVKTLVYNTMSDYLGKDQPLRTTASDLSANSEEPLLVYYSPDSKLKDKANIIDAGTWANFKNKGNTRLDLFLKLYYSNIKDISNSGQRHVGCFFGDAEKVANGFFTQQNEITNLDKLYVTVSEDRKMIGFEFDYKNPYSKQPAVTAHYRLPHCLFGAKTALFQPDQIKNAKRGMSEESRSVASLKNIREPAAAPAAQTEENGFDIYDNMNKDDAALEINLPRFKLRADYDQMKPQPETRPWKGMDIRGEANGIKFAQTVLDYFLDSLGQDDQNANNNFIAQNIKPNQTQWCHMPWLNVGDSGREMIHGLTKERDLGASAIYPDAASTQDKEGSDWGIGFYNDIACVSANQIFGSLPGKALAAPDFTKAQFPDGSVSVKVLFTTANLDALNGSFKWNANVSLPKSTSRRLREVKMIQIDVAVKDSTLIGTRKETDGWMMTTFYYDASYVSTSRHKYKGALAGLLKMRPIGIQTGFDPSTSLIFKDSKTNSSNNQFYGANPQLMNGPADNPQASCLSCHGSAGTTVKMVPGVKDDSGYSQIKNKGLDFSQQLALAKRNYETRAGQKVAKGW